MEYLNFASSVNRSLNARASNALANTATALLPAENFARLVHRIVLVTSLGPADLTSGTWEPYSRTVVCEIRLGGFADGATIIDFTNLGEANVAEYVVPLVIPAKTEFSVNWRNVLSASAVKCTANLQLATA